MGRVGGSAVWWAFLAAFLTTTSVKAQNTVCGGELTQQSGVVTSPSYPESYPNNQRCQWTVTARKNEIVDLRFNKLDLEGTSSNRFGEACPDYVRVYDGDSASSPLLATMCRIKTTSELAKIYIRSTSNVMFIVFESDYQGQRPGFVASYWTHECPEFSYGTEACNISCSCNKENTAYCNNTSGDCVCKKEWTSNDCSQDVDECLNQKAEICPYDYTECANRVGSFECVCKAGLALNANGECKVKPGSVCDQGHGCSHFCVKISGQQQCYCPDNMKLVGNTCQACSNVAFGKDCRRNCDCVQNNTQSCDSETAGCICLAGWTSANCAQDIDECSQLMGSVCPSSSEQCLNTPGGYQCDCKSGLPRSSSGSCEGCSFTLTNASGVIKSPNFPNQAFTDVSCNWTINAAGSGMTVSFSFSELCNGGNYWRSDSCYYGGVDIYDGSNSSFPLLGRYCGCYSNTGIVRSSGRSLFIQFSTSIYSSQRRFSGTYSTSVYQVVRTTTTLPSGIIASPGFPVGPSSNVTYSWTINVASNTIVNLSYSDFGLGECGKHYLDVYDGTQAGPERLAQFCGNRSSGTIVSTRNYMHIIYSHEGSTSGKGFNGSYITDACWCYPYYTSSCNHPTGPCVCKSGITGSYCDQDIDECQSNPCPAHSSCYNQFGSFKCTCWNGTQVNVNGSCDDWSQTLYGPSGEIRSPGLTNGRLLQVNYTYSLLGTRNEVVSLRFKQFDVQENYKCFYIVVEVYDGVGPERKLIGQYCGTTVPALLRSTRPEMSVYFKSQSYSSHQSSFMGTYEVHECPLFMYGEEKCTSTCSCAYDTTRVCDNTNGVCFCDPGWEGSGCTQDLDECRNKATCPYYSECFNEPGSYSCECISGFVKNEAGYCEESIRCSDEMRQRCSHFCDVDQALGIETCYCPEDFVLLDDYSTCGVTLYPNGNEAKDNSALTSKKGQLLQGDDFIVFNSLIPFGDGYQNIAKVWYQGVITFNDQTIMNSPDLGMALTKQQNLLALFWTENRKINSGDVTYHAYETCSSSLFMDPDAWVSPSPKKDQVVERAIRDVKKFHDLPDFEVSVVFVATWTNVQTKDCFGSNTFQAVLVSGHTPPTAGQSYLQVEEKSYIIFIYKDGDGICQEGQPFEVGVVTDSGVSTLAIDKSDPSLTETFGNTGYRGVSSFQVGQKHSESLMCQRYLCKHADLIGNPHFQAEIDELYQCPCSLDKLGLQWQLLRDEGDTLCFSIRAVAKRRLLRTNQRNRVCCYTWTKPGSDSWEDWHESWKAGSFIPKGQLLVTDPWQWSPSLGSSNPYQDAVENMQARTWCCEQSYQFCGSFYKIFGDLQCTTHPVFVPASALGDPLITTVDGHKYFMNGWAEYILSSIDQEAGINNFTLQGRTEKVEFDGKLSNGTVFTGFAAQEGSKDNVQVLLGTTGTSMVLLANGNDFTNDFYADPFFTWSAESASVQRSDEGIRVIVAVSFECGVSFKVHVGDRSLEIDIEMDNSLRNKTKGLLGNNNGDPNDDFLLPDGTILPPNSTERHIFQQFASKYMVTALTSVFTYTKGESFADYQHNKFVPLFFDEMSSEALLAARKICGENDDACIYDLTVTGNEQFAKNTRAAKEVHEETKRRLNNNPPSISWLTNEGGEKNQWLVREGKINIAAVEAKDVDNEAVTIELLKYLPGVTLDQNGTITYTPDLDNPISLNIRAKDTVGSYSSILAIKIVVCRTCSNHGACDTLVTAAEFLKGQYNILKCNCLPAYTGNTCESELDACKSLPCAEGQDCVDLTAGEQGSSSVGYTCGPCPHGTTDVNGLCEDINECTDSTLCDQECINTHRSYRCDCRSGYRLDLKKNRICVDIDECDERKNTCEQVCRNTPGSYTCACLDGYTLRNDSSMCEIDVNTAGLCQSCDQVCYTSKSQQVTCDCNLGFQINNNNTQECIDIDECNSGSNSPCSQVCTNTWGQFVCSCYPGYKLDTDGVSCLECDSFHFGESCSSNCNCRGRGRCDRVQGCICNEHWTGTNCDKDVNECRDPKACPNGRICQNEPGSFSCACPDGYRLDNGACLDIDECKEYSNKCDLNLEDCYNKEGSYNCLCKKGFKQNDLTGVCEDIDECVQHSDSCEHLCVNGVGSYRCACHRGFSLAPDRSKCVKDKGVCNLTCSHGCSVDDNGTPFCLCPRGYKQVGASTCGDINECASSSTNPCEQKDSCINTDGKYSCSCKAGFRLDNDGRSCVACSIGTWGVECNNSCACGKEAISCDPVIGCQCKPGCSGVHCTDVFNRCTSGELTCQLNEECVVSGCNSVCQCAKGYVWNNGQCQDDDECLNKKHNCDQVCTNRPGSFVCSCFTGYSYNTSSKTCDDIDECQNSYHNCEHVCTNTKGGFVCSCHPGYSYDAANNTCNDIDECKSSALHNCQQVCTNTKGGFVCSCNPGYSYDVSANTCNEIDECQDPARHNCQQVCTNTKGSFVCSCSPGYSYEAANSTCNDVNECKSAALHNCEQVCTNTKGSFVCSCQPGYSYDASTNICRDIDECKSSALHNCEQVCTNTKGSFVCSCHPGYSYDVSANTCNDIDECQSSSLHNCDHTCTNTKGSFVCSCHPGYSYNSTTITCNDVNECLQNHPCSKICVNTVGSYHCSCPAGQVFLADGVTCDCPNGCDVGCSKCVENNTDRCNKTNGQCFCKKGWTSDNCSVDVNECLRNPCPNNKNCRNLNGGFECVCWNELQKSSDGTCHDCNRTLTERSGYIMSSNYPDNYQDNTYCTWTIAVSDPEAVIELSFIDYKVEGCPYDYVRIYNSVNQQVQPLVRVCDNWRTTVVSKRNSLYLAFTTNFYTTLNGFLAFYTSYVPCKTKKCSHTCSRFSTNPDIEKCHCPDWMTISQSNDSNCIYTNACNTTITEPVGSIVSPNYPNQYPVNSNCRWTIQGGSNSFIKLRFYDLSLEKSFQCIYDYVSVYDGNSESAQQIGRFCENSLQPVISSSGSAIHIVFKSDYSLSYAGFRVSYYIYEK